MTTEQTTEQVAEPTSDTPPSSLAQTLWAVLAATLACGVLIGLPDALRADMASEGPDGWLATLGCYSVAVLTGCVLFGAVLLPVGLLSHSVLRQHPGHLRQRVLVTIGLAIGLFGEFYWVTRPLFDSGLPALSPRRLAITGVLVLVASLMAFLAARSLSNLPRAAHRVLRGVALFAIVGGVWFLRQERHASLVRGELNERNRALPNVLLVIVDALRADQLAAYGNIRVKTPHMDQLAARGVLFENCFAQAPYTLASFGSILTGKYPSRHGLVAQEPGIEMKPNVTLAQHLKTARITELDERLREGDFATAAFMTGAVSQATGLAQGFDAYSEAMMGHGLVQSASAWSRFRSELLPWLLKNKVRQRLDPSLVVSTARAWIEKHQKRRWMAMVHLYSTHTPYDAPAVFKQPYLDPSYGGPYDSFYSEERYAIERGEYEPSTLDVQRIRDLYLAAVAQADAQLGELLDSLEQLELLEDTLVILTSDHGEDLGEWHALGAVGRSQQVRFWEHNHMWQSNLRVPLIMANTRLLPHAKRVPELVESIDLLPTLCDVMGLELPRENAEVVLDGESMSSLMLGLQRGEEPVPRVKRYSFAENNLFFSIQDLQHKLIVPRRLLSSDASAQLFEGQHWVRFYDLQGPGKEVRNVLEENHELALELWRVLWEHHGSMPQAQYNLTERDREQVDIFRALGYAWSGDHNRAQDASSEEPGQPEDPEQPEQPEGHEE